MKIKVLRPTDFRGSFDAKADVERSVVAEFELTRPDDKLHTEICEEVFEATNAPRECVQEEMHFIPELFNENKLYCLSTGDVVSVNGSRYLCASLGWEYIGETFDHK